MPARASRPYRKAGGGLVVRVRLTPKSASDEVGGIDIYADTPVLKARVRAAPEKGRANAALEKLVAGWLGVPRSTVRVTAGATARIKSVAIAGDADALAAAIEARTGAGSAGVG